MSRSTRFAVIGLIGAFCLPSLCSAQIIIFHKNWHGLGSSKSQRRVSDRGQHQRSFLPQHKQSSRIAPTTNRTTERRLREPHVASEHVRFAPSVPERGHPPVRVAEHRYQAPEVVGASVDSHTDPAVDSALAPTIPYDLIESPFRQPHREEKLHVRSKYRPPITQREGPRTQRAVIPNTLQLPVWKTPLFLRLFRYQRNKTLVLASRLSRSPDRMELSVGLLSLGFGGLVLAAA